jgi:large-conductance mechanosensitive channel
MSLGAFLQLLFVLAVMAGAVFLVVKAMKRDGEL